MARGCASENRQMPGYRQLEVHQRLNVRVVEVKYPLCEIGHSPNAATTQITPNTVETPSTSRIFHFSGLSL